MASDINAYLQNNDGDNLLPITDWDNLNDIPTVLQSPDKIITTDALQMTTHNLTIGSTFAGTGKVLTFQLNGLPFWSISLVVHPTAAWTGDSSTPLCTTPDISNDTALSGTSYTLDWKYLSAHIYQNNDNAFSFAFHDGYGYIDADGQTVAAGYNIMTFGTQMFI